MLRTESPPAAPDAAEPTANTTGARSPRRVVDPEAARAAVWPFLATRLAFLLIGLTAPALFSDHPIRASAPPGTGWVRWDAQWFIGIAAHGYTWSLAPHYSAAAFFPLYPLAIHVLGLTGLDLGLAGALIANASFLGALYYLYRLVRLDEAAPAATRAIWLLALFPTALVFFIPYTESLYLLLAVLTLWYLRRRRWLAAGVAGALGALTRQTGLVLLAPYLIEWWMAYRQRREGASDDARETSKTMWRALPPALLMPLAVAGHLAYLWRVTGSPTAFLRVQRAWHRQFSAPWSGIVATVQRWTRSPGTWRPLTTPVQHVHMVLELGAVLLFLGLLALGARRVRPSYTVYAGAVWLAALLSPAIDDGFQLPLMSSSRVALSVFPSFIALALLLRRPGPYQAWLTASAMLLGLVTTFYILGGWVA